MTAAERSFAFVQFDLPGHLGLDDGRYPVRSGERIEHVLVVEGSEAPRRGGRRRRPRSADPEPEPVPITKVTVVDSEPLGDGEDAARWLAETSRDSERAEGRIARALAVLNRAVHAQRAASHDPFLADVAAARALTVRLGHGGGDQVAEGRWADAVVVPQESARRRRRTDAMRPQERVAAVLGGHDRIDACEALVLRARADLDAGRVREATLQLHAGLNALLRELAGRAGSDQEEDLATLGAARADVAAAADVALDGDISPAQADLIAETLGVCERVLRRRQIRRD